MSVPLLIVASMFILPRYLWVSLVVAGGIVGVYSSVYCAVSKPAGLKVAHYDAADAVRVAKQLIEILFFDPDSYINMPDRYQFIKGLHWLAYPEGLGIKLPVVSPKIDPVGLKVAHPDAADAAKQLINILCIHPDSYINMPDRYQFITGLHWLAYPQAPDAEAVHMAKQLIKILFIHPDLHINMPDRYQFIMGLLWFPYPQGLGIKIPVVSPNIDLVGRPRIDPAGLKVAHPDAAEAARMAKQLINILFFHPYINMPTPSIY
ncbi:hypothetical protein Tco_0904198 [Tanacetum coccineum]